MATETIREFLVGVGFKVDEAGLKKFETSINNGTKAVLALAGAIEGTAIIMAAGIARLASNLEALYFASVRTNSSAAGLKLLDVAAQNLGASAGEAEASVEAFAQKLRENPGNVTLLESLVGQLKRTKDGTIVALDAYERFVAMLKARFPGQQQYLAYQYGSFLGLSPQLLQRFLAGDLTEEMARFRKELGAGDWDAAAKKAHEFEQHVRAIGLEFDGIKARIAAGAFTALRPQLEELAKWIETHQTQISTFVTNAITGIGSAAEITAKAFMAIVHGYDAVLRKATALGQWFADHAPQKMVDDVGGAVSNLLHLLGLESDEDFARQESYYKQTYGLPAENNPGNLEFHGQPGATRAGRFASFGNVTQGLAALARQLELYGSRGLNTIQGIVSKYAPPGENDTAAYIANVSKALGVGAGAQLDLHDPKVLQALMAAIIRQEGHGGEVTPEALNQAALNASRDFRAGTFADTAFGQWLTGLANRADVGRATATGETVASINQKTDIHVYGSGDPALAAGKVTEAQRRTNQELARNVAAAVQ